MSDQITKYKEGSLLELWTISYPMILAFMSGNFMMFVDRLFLANYSIPALNAATTAGMMATVFLYGAATITAISEVFAGQFNGAKEYSNVAAPTWQMLWFSLGVFVVYILVALFGGPYLLPQYHYHDQGLPYFQWMLFLGVTIPAIAALTGFFVGIGKTRSVMVITILGNIVNVVLDPLFIFVFDMGAKGAAIATGISGCIQVGIFLWIMLKDEYRKMYGTAKWQFELPLFLRCLKVGVPSATGHMIEWTAWAISIRMMAMAGELYLTVASIGQSLYMLIAFGFDGIQKAITTLSANRMGAKKWGGVKKVWTSGIILMLILGLPFGIVMLGYPMPIIQEFLSSETSPEDMAILLPLLRITAAGVFLYYLVDGFTWICVGVLTAAEDTFFVMWVNGITAWLCGLAPVLYGMVYLKLSPAWYFMIISFYGACNAVIFYRRLRKKVWKEVVYG